MRARSPQLRVRLGHERGDQPGFLGGLLDQGAEQRHAVGRCEHLGVGEVELVLTFPALGVEAEQPEVEFGHVVGDPIEEGHRVEGDLEVVGRRRLHRATAGDGLESAAADGFGLEHA